MNKLLLQLLTAASLSLGLAAPALAQAKKEFDVCWTIYAGWMPWEYAQSHGIIKKWADKYGITINVTQINDYSESLNQYTLGQFDGCTMTNIDVLTVPAVGGIDSTVLIPGSYSNGNDGIVIKGKGKTLADIKGMDVNLVELSVSHYFLARALETVGLQERDIRVVNTSDADLSAAFATSSVQAVVAWNPQLSNVLAQPDATLVYDSSKLPGEILDLMVVNTKVLQDNPDFGKALTGAWYETLALMVNGDEKVLTHMAQASGTDLASYKAQLKTTGLFYTATDNLAFVTSPSLPESMQRLAKFSFEKGLLGSGATSADAIGMTFPGNVLVGDAQNVKVRFDDSFIKLAAEGKL